MNNNTLPPATTTALVEGVLLAEDTYISAEEISNILGLSKCEVSTALDLLSNTYTNTLHGVEIAVEDGKYLMVPKKNVWNTIATTYKKRAGGVLSAAALEVLTIIAYSQPITRSSIDGIRGANSTSSIVMLTKNGLVTIRGYQKTVGNPALYVTTNTFLRLFNLSSLKELPLLNEKEIQQFRHSHHPG